MPFNSYSAIEDHIGEACDAIRDGWYSNCTQAANVYEVLFRRLRRHWNRGASKSVPAVTKKGLTEARKVAITIFVFTGIVYESESNA